ncbi:MAG TPA: DNA primase [Segeticoccus sp.]|uniref:DNA primase n=1 Tax=Segeticoccus sp. TaxID=2706531 RepID=UPI002D7ED3E0|nr:DNA primase [Segeticoccus sp.]HET8600463.1 DNA primase [Segeticoccus sp.]
MAGLIKSEDIALVKERSSLEDVVREHVTLRSAGPGSLKGLCPFHDEKTPSFTIRPAVGAWHCFGCGEGGDVISFVMKVEHLAFTEAVERLAGKLGLELHYEAGGGPCREEGSLGRRARLVEAHRVAGEFYAAALVGAAEARAGRDFLRARGFDRGAAETFGVGFAPRQGEELTRHLRGKGFTDDEIVAGGLAGRGNRGLYDRFRGRLVWPIRDITGDTVGFGARRLFDDDRIEAKYLNTAETPIYKKTSVLYGLDLAKKAISRDRRAVVVEGYTDVMACHLAGVETAVATCGTAFGVDHIKTLRRLMRDEAGGAPARTIFTFDGDAAGQKAAMRAFAEDQRWASQSFVAVADSGQDPCELRQSGGDPAVRALIEDAVPMFEFAVRTTVRRFDLDLAEGRVQAMRAAAPIIHSIRDRALRPEYVRTVAGWLGVEVEQLAREVQRAGRVEGRGDGAGTRRGEPVRAAGHTGSAGEVPTQRPAESMPAPDLRDPVTSAERQLLQVLLQFPQCVEQASFEALPEDAFGAPAHHAVHDAVRAAGGPAAATSTAGWAAAVHDHAAQAVQPLVSELAVASLPARYDAMTGRPDGRYVQELLVRVQEVGLARQIADALSALRRLDADADREHARELGFRLQTLQRARAELRAGLA